MQINSDSLELRIDEPWVPADEFKELFREFLGLVSEVSNAVARKKDAFDWLVAVESGSNVLRLQPQPKNASAEIIPIALSAVDHGLAKIVAEGKRPNYFSDKALKHVITLSKHSRSNNQPSERISAFGPQNERRSFRDLQACIESMLRMPQESWGSIRGRMLVISAKRGDSFTIDDELTGLAVSCKFETDMTDAVFHAFKRRVSVEGMIKYSADGNPTSIRIESESHIEILKEQEELPGFEDVLGIHNRAG
ncbi:hypothetical protein JW859_04710 [bacterium]|nr:hypothetical protein [bacterium]